MKRDHVCGTRTSMISMAGESKSPAMGYDIHLQAPHLMPDDTCGRTIITYAWEVQKPGACVLMARARHNLYRFQPIEPF